MDVRNVQRSGSTYYCYLPVTWCRQNNISRNTKLILETTSEGDLVITPHNKKIKQTNLVLNLPVHDMRVVNKFIMASYLNPVKSFRIKLDKEISSLEILDQKRLLSGIEIVELSGNQISCESSIFADDPDVILKTMVKKLTNTLHVMIKDGSQELLERYEEEIDRSNTLIVKSAVSALTFHRNYKLRNIELFYIAILSKNLEWFADQLINIRKHTELAKKCLTLIKLLLETLNKLNITTATTFAKEAISVCSSIEKVSKRGNLGPLLMSINQCADTIVDWAINKEIDKI